MTTDVYVASAFTKSQTGGNKAGVVLQDKDLSEAEKINLAYQLGYSETVFVTCSDWADFKLKYYTGVGEVPLCGHATIGAFTVMKELNMLSKPEYEIETESGKLKIAVNKEGLIFMEQTLPQFYDQINPSDIGKCFEPFHQPVDETLPNQIVSTGLRDIIVPIVSLEVLHKMIPDLTAITGISREFECVGIHAFSLVNDSDVTAVCRNFAPLYGIDEESATGTSNCALACYLHKYGIRKEQYVFEQGYNLNSISRIYVQVEGEDDNISGVYVGGFGSVDSLKSLEV